MMRNMFDISDKSFGKKEIELEELYYFVDVYEIVTGLKISKVDRSERPDFIVHRSDGLTIGIELTKITRDPNTQFVEKIHRTKIIEDHDFVLNELYRLIEQKEQKIKDGNWALPQNTLLVLQLMDINISELLWVFDKSLQKDFTQYIFSEIWIADYSGIEAYGDLELFCLKPIKLWGYHQRLHPDRKPYG